MTNHNKREDSASGARSVSRREFLSGTAAALPFMIMPRHVLGGAGYVAPSDKVTLGCIGVGAQGTRVMIDFLKQPDVQVIAVCDVNRESSDYSEWGKNELRDTARHLLGDSNWGSDWSGPTAGREPARRIVEAYYAKRQSASAYHGCTAYNDFRELLSKEKGLDGVVVCTPDHWHAPVSMAAMKAGKHVYCQKPLTHSVAEARSLANMARATKVATQVAIANSASESTRQLTEWITAGVIGPVRRVQNWSTRPFWPQGINRPDHADAVPNGFDWDLWLGPAPERPFSHVYLPFVWRGWFDFGNGALGDMAQYSFDTIFRALKLGAPEAVEASSSKRYPETFPEASIVRWNFPARADMPPVQLTWYDGGLRPERPAELDDLADLTGEDHEGLLFIGEGGIIFCGFEGQHPRLLPALRMKTFTPPPKSLPRSIGHYQEFIAAARGGAPGAANFEFEGPVAEAVLLGNIALRVDGRLRWDSAAMKITDSSAAQALVQSQYRGAWGEGLNG